MSDCYGVQIRRWDNDYPSWDDYDIYDPAAHGASRPLRFATQCEAEEWITWHCDKQYESDRQRWEAAEERIRPHRELYERRRLALQEAGLWRQPGESTSPLVVPATYPSDREPIRRNDNYRVVADADMDFPLHQGVDPVLGVGPDPCPVCEVSGGVLVWRDGMFSCHGCWTRTKDSVPFKHADGCPKVCWLPGCSAHSGGETNSLAVSTEAAL